MNLILLEIQWASKNLNSYVLLKIDNYNASRHGASDSVTDSSVLSNPTDAQNVSCLRLCGRDICPEKLYLNIITHKLYIL